MTVNQRHYAKNDECCTRNFSFILLEIRNAQNTLNTEPREVGHGGQWISPLPTTAIKKQRTNRYECMAMKYPSIQSKKPALPETASQVLWDCSSASAWRLLRRRTTCCKDKTSVCLETRGRRWDSATSLAARNQEVSAPTGGGTHSKAAAKASSLPLGDWMQDCISYTLGRVSGRLQTSSDNHNHYSWKQFQQ